MAVPKALTRAESMVGLMGDLMEHLSVASRAVSSVELKAWSSAVLRAVY